MKKSNLRKLYLYISANLIALTLFAPSVKFNVNAETKEVYIGGMTAGFTLSENGVSVVGFCEVFSGGKASCPAKESGLKVGDIIVEADGEEISGANGLNALLNRSGEKELPFKILRSEEELTLKIKPVKDGNGNVKIGVLIRDSVSGIGTVTYITKDTHKFGSLGHAVLDESKREMSLFNDKVYPCSVLSVVKGVRGRAGELKGVFMNDAVLASAERITDSGIYGTFSQDYDYSTLNSAEIAPLSTAHIGKAVIYSTVDGAEVKEYGIGIIKVDRTNGKNKNFVIKITDEELLNRTGGIVQGMSGSPIVQDGKLIGAVTHVFINDPTRGFGIGVENMLDCNN